MSKHPRLINDDFIALRSVYKEPWIMTRGGGTILWKHNRKWWRVDESPFAIPLHHGYPRPYKGEVWERAHCALDRIEAYGLVESNVERCCPGTECHLNDRLVWSITETGRELVERAKLLPQSMPPPMPINRLPTDGGGTSLWTRLMILLGR